MPFSELYTIYLVCPLGRPRRVGMFKPFECGVFAVDKRGGSLE